MAASADWDRVIDVVVVGSGGAALVAATMAADEGAEVLVTEKDSMLGGTTAVSGGVAWLPNNHHMAEVGIPDSREDALAYIRRLTNGHEHDPAVLEAFVDTAPDVLRYLEAHTPLRMQPVSNFPDYFFAYDVPGKKWGGRSVEPMPYAVGEELPEWRDKLVTRGTLMSLGAATMLSEDFAVPTPELEAELARREAQDVRTNDFIEEQAKYGAMIPQQADLAAFLRSANDIADSSGLDWIQITPTEPVPGTSGASEIAMTMQLEGGYYQVLEYLRELEDLSRIVVVDTIQVNAGGSEGDEEGGGSVDVTGAPTLSVNLTARMFTQATVVSRPVAETPTTTPGDATATTVAADTSSTGAAN